MNQLIRSGLIFLGVGLAMNIVGRVGGPVMRANPGVAVASLFAVWMVVSVALVLFGLVQLVRGALAKNGPKV